MACLEASWGQCGKTAAALKVSKDNELVRPEKNQAQAECGRG